MKKRIILSLAVFAGFTLSAQQVALKAPQLEVVNSDAKIKKQPVSQALNKTQAVLWSEDFASGIPTGWTSQVVSDAGVLLPNGLWEYRGPATTPNNTVGSRGAFAAGTGPIVSPTVSNGFIIFDSDYMDNNGSTTGGGTGNAPAPHFAKLTTTSMDLTGSPFVEVKMNSHARKFQARYLVAVSNDGGTTFADTVEFHTDLGVNDLNANNGVVSANISAIAGNQANVVLQFLFDGTLGTAPNQGYYYWQIDDIEVRDLPRNELRFTEASDGAPAHDAIYDGGGLKKGTMSISQVVPINYDANLYNFGSQTQTNVVLNVEVYNAGTLVTTLSSPAVPTLASGDTATYVSLVTPTWTPSAPGVYDVVYTFSSDSIPSTMAVRDSFQQIISNGDGITGSTPYDINGIDWGVFSNSFGTNTTDYGFDGGGQMVMVDIRNGNNDGEVDVEGVQIRFSTLTIDGGDILVELYDTTGFTYAGGFAGSSLLSEQFNLGVGTSGTLANFTFTGGPNGTGGYKVPQGTYYLAVFTFSNGGANTIRIANDQSYPQFAIGKGMYFVADSRWYTGFSNTLTFNAPHIRLLSENVTSSLEDEVSNQLSVYPNPTTGNVSLSLTQGGTYTIELVDMVGNRVSSEEVTINGNETLSRNYSQLTKGIYLLNVKGDNFNRTTKLTIQ